MTIAIPDVLKSYLDLPKQEINLYQNINNIHSAKVCLTVQNFSEKILRPPSLYFQRGVPCIFPKNGRKIKRDFQNLLKIFTGSTLTYFSKSLQFPRKYPKTPLFVFSKRGPLPIVLLHSNVYSFMCLVWWWKILNNSECSGNDRIADISAGYTQVLELAFTDSTKLRIQANFGSCQSDHVLWEAARALNWIKIC